eukprot:6198549-Pleurochrysis_carterae.AAC.1
MRHRCPAAAAAARRNASRSATAVAAPVLPELRASAQVWDSLVETDVWRSRRLRLRAPWAPRLR